MPKRGRKIKRSVSPSVSSSVSRSRSRSRSMSASPAPKRRRVMVTKKSCRKAPRLCGYIVFSMEQRKQNASKFSKLSQVEIVKAIAGKWHALSDAQKAKYNAKAKQRMAVQHRK